MDGSTFGKQTGGWALSQPFFAAFPPIIQTDNGQPKRAADLEQRQSQLLRLHGWLYHRFPSWQIDIHPHWETNHVVRRWQGQTAEHLELAYGRSYRELRETVRNFAFPEVETQTFWQSALISLRLDLEHVHVSFNIGERAWLDATNLYNKIQHSLNCQQSLLNVLTDLFVFGYRLKERLGSVGLGKGAPPAEIFEFLDQFRSMHGQLYVARTFPLEDSSLTAERIGLEILTQVRLLYPLYQFVCWSEDNHYLW